DIASNTPDKHDDRRGIAGDLFVAKVAGAAAAEGRDLDAVEAAAIHANRASRTLGVAFTGCTLPGATEPLFTVEPGTFSLGLGIHGEQGISSHKMMSAEEIATMLVDKILEEEPERKEGGYTGRAAVLVNGLGATKYEELFVLYAAVAELLKKRAVTIVAPVVGEQVTSLDMAGVSLSLMFLDDDLENLWLAPADTPAFRKGNVVNSAEKRVVAKESKVAIAKGSSESAAQGEKIANILALMEKVTREAEPYLGKIDAIAGDGDHGQGMVLGSTAAAKSAWESVKAGAGARTVLARAGAAWSEGAGGTSGALWGGALSKMATGLSDDDAVDTDALVRAVIEGARSIVTMGGAQVGDKTMVDAVVPFADSLEVGLESGIPIVENWMRAAKYARKAAEKTAEITARKGRARTHGDASLGTPDPGAISFSLLMEKIGEALGRCGSDTSL
ncbi:MAG: dihydroxyacetone kinase family protein, partial [Arcanobacterium sp.]|nr:dihydroxyacetone kinase family protein [Arcanobacterium sp.]